MFAATPTPNFAMWTGRDQLTMKPLQTWIVMLGFTVISHPASFHMPCEFALNINSKTGLWGMLGFQGRRDKCKRIICPGNGFGVAD